ncbi:MAG: hypothetical protein Q9M13_07190, partial [Mariprofundales bacterium]|nr:hypothetical protein [Mariprofundales bacterium]
MRLFNIVSIIGLFSLLASCGAGSSGGGAVSGVTQVTIPFASSGSASVAGGALVASQQTTVPAAVQSMAVTALSATGVTLAGPVTATRPNLSASMTLANANGVTFLVQAFDVYGSQIYEGRGTQDLTGVPVTVPVVEQVLLGGVAATGLPVANATLKITDATGRVSTTTTDATGNYRVVLPTNLAYPLLLESTLPNGTVIASIMTGLGKVHTNTISTLSVAKTLGVASYSQISGGFNTMVSTYANVAVPVQALDDDLNASAQQVMQQLGLKQFTILGNKDPLHDPNFVADGTGLDGVMDSMRMEERDVDGDGQADLVLSGRGGAGTPILSVRSTTNSVTREQGSLALSGATIAGDQRGNGVVFTSADSVALDSAGGVSKLVTAVAPAALGISNQTMNHFVSVVIEGFDEAGVVLSADPYNTQVVGSLMDAMLQGFQSIQAAGGTPPLTEVALDALAKTIKSALTGSVSSVGVVLPSFDIPGMVQAMVNAAIPQQQGGGVVGGGTIQVPSTFSDSYARATTARIPVVLTPPFTVGSNGVASVSSDVFTNISPLLAVPSKRVIDQHGLANSTLEALSMLPNGQEGWAVGVGGRILHTVDGGINWTAQMVPIDLSGGGALLDVYAVDSSHVWAVGRTDSYSQTPLILFYNGTT